LLICCVPVLVSGCSAVRSLRGHASSATIGAPEVVTTTTTPEAFDLNFGAMDFVEMNNLFMLLLESLPEGSDTSTADAFYGEALEAMLEGDSELADFYLEQAILLLLALEP
jgi:hypothetical protein